MADFAIRSYTNPNAEKRTTLCMAAFLTANDWPCSAVTA